MIAALFTPLLTPLGWVLATLLISLLVGLLGKCMGDRNKVTDKYCADHRKGCSKELDRRLGKIEKDISRIFDLINEHFLGLAKAKNKEGS